MANTERKFTLKSCKEIVTNMGEKVVDYHIVPQDDGTRMIVITSVTKFHNVWKYNFFERDMTFCMCLQVDQNKDATYNKM